jgi:probable addiction module antidote protein
MRKTKKFNDYLVKSLKDPKEASAYLNVALEEYKKDNDSEAFLLALRDVAEACGGLSSLSEKTKLNRQNLYKVLSSKGNPRLQTFGNILNGLGFQLSITPNISHSVVASKA